MQYLGDINNEAACLTIEELNDVSEVHVVLQDDVPVDLHKCQGNEEDKVTRRDTLGCPDGFPDCKYIIIHKLWKTNHMKRQEMNSLRAQMGGQLVSVETDKSGSRCLVGLGRGYTEIDR